MANDIDLLLKQLKSLPVDHDLCDLERAVSRRIESERAQIWPTGGLTVQLAVFCGALILGLAVAQFSRFSAMPAPLSSEIIVLSDDSALAPSVRLEGGS
jgi:hypothetical protein